MKKEMSPWARIKREAPGVQQSYREKKKSRKWLIALAGVLAVALLLSVLRIPERLLQFGEPNTEVSVPAMNLTGVYNSLLAEIIEMEQEADWDGDGLRNGADPYRNFRRLRGKEHHQRRTSDRIQKCAIDRIQFAKRYCLLLWRICGFGIFRVACIFQRNRKAVCFDRREVDKGAVRT